MQSAMLESRPDKKRMEETMIEKLKQVMQDAGSRFERVLKEIRAFKGHFTVSKTAIMRICMEHAKDDGEAVNFLEILRETILGIRKGQYYLI